MPKCNDCDGRIWPWTLTVSGYHRGENCIHHFTCLVRAALDQIDDRLKVLEEHAALGKTVIDAPTEAEAKMEIDIMSDSR